MYKVESRKSKVKSANRTNIFLLIAGLLPVVSQAQCAMCRAVLETEEGGTKAEAVNDGIVYLMVFPYLLVGILGYVIYRLYNRKKKA